MARAEETTLCSCSSIWSLMFGCIVLLVHFAAASESDSLQDFCIAELGDGVHLNGFACREPSWVTSKDFVFQGFRSDANVSQVKFAPTLASVTEFPALNAQGIGMVKAEFGDRAVNPPHFHPRSAELVYVIEGSVYAAFVSTQNKLYAEILQKGDMFLVPKGLVHFQMNAGKRKAVVLGAFNSQNPGYQRLSTSLFGTEIPDEVLLQDFEISQRNLQNLRAKFKQNR